VSYNDYEKVYEEDADRTVLKYSRKDFKDAKWVPKLPQEFPFKTSQRMDDKYRI